MFRGQRAEEVCVGGIVESVSMVGQSCLDKERGEVGR